jgi:hypothetical protein
MTPRELEEYRALRATIRERGTTRIWVFLIGILAWAALTVATAALAGVPVAALVPLAVLVATFEAIFALHTGVERIGRYIQVFFETEDEYQPDAAVLDKREHDASASGAAWGSDTGRSVLATRERHGASASGAGVGPRATNKWEHTAMAFGRGVRGSAADPLFAAIFAIGTLLNFIPVLLAEPVAVEVATIGAAHFAFLARIALALRASKRQRAFELARFKELRPR